MIRKVVSEGELSAAIVDQSLSEKGAGGNSPAVYVSWFRLE